jgi:putative membrane protein
MPDRAKGAISIEMTLQRQKWQRMRAVGHLGLSLFGLTAVLLGGDTSPARAQPQGGAYGPGMMGDFGWGHMVFSGLMVILFWGGLIVAIVVAVRYLGGSRHGVGGGPAQAPPRTPLDILKERYARGEIDREEFEERRRALSE